MPGHKYRFELDQFVRVTEPRTYTQEEYNEVWAYGCYDPSPSRTKVYTACGVERGPLYEFLVSELGMDLTLNVDIGGVTCQVLRDLETYRFVAVPSVDVEEVKRVLTEALEDDLDYNVADDTITDRVTYRYWHCPMKPLPKEAGELTVEQLFDFYVDAESGMLDFGGLTSLTDIAINCAEKLAASRSAAAGSSGGPSVERGAEERGARLEGQADAMDEGDEHQDAAMEAPKERLEETREDMDALKLS